jgi:hypothetical protein
LKRRKKRVLAHQKRALARLWARLVKVPHLFAKAIILYCILAATGASWYCLRIEANTDKDPATLLGVILGFFGGELLLLCLKFVLNKDTASTDTEITTNATNTNENDTGI